MWKMDDFHFVENKTKDFIFLMKIVCTINNSDEKKDPKSTFSEQGPNQSQIKEKFPRKMKNYARPQSITR